MRIVVSDSGCLIDLRKVSLPDTFLRLPYEFLMRRRVCLDCKKTGGEHRGAD